MKRGALVAIEIIALIAEDDETDPITPRGA